MAEDYRRASRNKREVRVSRKNARFDFIKGWFFDFAVLFP